MPSTQKALPRLPEIGKMNGPPHGLAGLMAPSKGETMFTDEVATTEIVSAQRKQHGSTLDERNTIDSRKA